MRNSNSSRSARQVDNRNTSRNSRGSQRYARTSDSDYARDRFGRGVPQDSSRDSEPRGRDRDSKYSTDDGGYYSYRNFSSERNGRGTNRNNQRRYRDNEHSEWESDDQTTDRSEETDAVRRNEGHGYGPYRASSRSYESDSEYDRDYYNESRENRSNTYDEEYSRRNGRESRWGREDFGWGGRMNNSDESFRSDRDEVDRYGDMEGISGESFSRYSEIDEVEGQYDEDYRDRDSYNRTRRGSSGLRHPSGQRRS